MFINYDIHPGLLIDINIFTWHSKFQTDKASFREHWFLSQLNTIFLNSKIKKSCDLSFNFLKDSLSSDCSPSLSTLILISPETWIFETEIVLFAVDVVVGTMKVVLGNRFSACTCLAEMSRYKNNKSKCVAPWF